MHGTYNVKLLPVLWSHQFSLTPFLFANSNRVVFQLIMWTGSLAILPADRLQFGSMAVFFFRIRTPCIPMFLRAVSSSCILRSVSWVLYLQNCILKNVSSGLCPEGCILKVVSTGMYPQSCILRSVSWVLYRQGCILRSVSSGLYCSTFPSTTVAILFIILPVSCLPTTAVSSVAPVNVEHRKPLQSGFDCTWVVLGQWHEFRLKHFLYS